MAGVANGCEVEAGLGGDPRFEIEYAIRRCDTAFTSAPCGCLGRIDNLHAACNSRPRACSAACRITRPIRAVRPPGRRAVPALCQLAVGYEAAEDGQDDFDVLSGQQVVDRLVHALLDFRDPAGTLASVGRQSQLHLPPVLPTGPPLDGTERDEPCREPARIVAGLADEQLSKPGECQRLMVFEDSQHL